MHMQTHTRGISQLFCLENIPDLNLKLTLQGFGDMGL